MAEAERHVGRQREIIEELSRDGHPTDLALALLHTFELTLESHRRDRNRIAAEVARPGSL